jgi:hypothetical protein
VAALEVGDPVRFLVLMEADDATGDARRPPRHRSGRGLVRALDVPPTIG